MIAIEGGIFGFVFQNSLYSGVVAMLGGLVIVPVVSWLTPKKGRMEKNDVEEIFSAYQREITTSAKDTLGK